MHHIYFKVIQLHIRMSIMRSTLRTDSNKENGKPEYGFAKFTDIAFIWLANIVDK